MSLYSAKRWLSSTAIRMFSSSDEIDINDNNTQLSEEQKSQIEKKRGRGRPRKDLNAPAKSRFIHEGREFGKRRASSLRSDEFQHEESGPNDGKIRFLLTFKALPNNLQVLAKSLYPRARNKYEEHRIVCKIINDNSTQPREIFIPTFRKLSQSRSFKEIDKKVIDKVFY